MTLESCDAVRVTKIYRELIPGLWTGNGERSWTGQGWHPWHVVLSADCRPQVSSSWQCQVNQWLQYL